MDETDVPDELNIGGIEQIKALTHPLRQRIFEQMALEPASTKQVALALGEKPTRLYHHVNILEKAGLVRLVETHQRRGATEKIYAAAAKRLRLDPSALIAAGVTPSTRNQAQLSAIDTIFERTRGEVAELIAQQPDTLEGEADQEEALFAWVDVRCSAEELPELRRRIEGLMQHGAGDDQDVGEEPKSRYRLLIGFYPVPDGSRS